MIRRGKELNDSKLPSAAVYLVAAACALVGLKLVSDPDGIVLRKFSLLDESGHMRALCRFINPAFPDMKSAFDSVDCAILWHCPSLKGVPEKCISLIQSLYANNRRRVHAYDDLSPNFIMGSGVRQNCLLSSFLFHFVIEMAMEIALFSTENDGLDIFSNRKL